MNSRERACVILFVKYPEEGSVKTRLAGKIGAVHAAALYRCFVEDMLRVINATGLACRICFTPEEKASEFRAWLGTVHPCTPQQGVDLGERMKNALSTAYSSGFKHALVIGSDMPDLPPSILMEAVNAIASGFSVSGPAEDGGYYLIGFGKHSFLPRTFDGIEWSSETVMERTIAALQAAGRRIYLLPTRRDIDTFEDLLAFVSRNRESGAAPSTMRFLRENPSLVIDNSRMEAIL